MHTSSSRGSELSNMSTPLIRKSEQSVLRYSQDTDISVDNGSDKWGVSITTFKSIIGGGFIALPYALAQGGSVAGIIVILIVWLCTSVTTKQLVECSRRIQEHDPSVSLEDIDYGKLGDAAYQKWGNAFSVIPLLATQFIAGCAYIVFISSTLAYVIADSEDEVEKAHFWLAVLIVGIECVLAMAPNPAFLVSTANFGCIAFLFAIVFIFSTAASQNPPSLENTVPFNSLSGLYICFGISVFTFSAHAEAVSIYATAAKQARSAYLMIIDIVLLIVAVVYVTFAVFSYMCFGDSTNSIIFDNLGATLSNSFVKGCISAMLLCNYPLTVYPVHQSIEILLGLTREADPPKDIEMQRKGERTIIKKQGEKTLLMKEDRPPSNRLSCKQAFSRLVIVISSGLIAMSAGSKFGFISAIGGGLNGVIAFVLPPIIHVKLHGGWSLLPWYMVIFNIFLIFLGLLGGGGSVYQGIQGLFQ